MWLICRVAFNRGKTKLLVRGTQDAEWVFCPRIKSIKNDKVTIQCCDECAHFVRLEHFSPPQTQAWKRSIMPKHPNYLHFRKPPINRWSSKRQTILEPSHSMLSFRGEKQPLLDVFEEDDCVVVLAELPGMEEKDVNIEADETTVTITAKNSVRTYLKKIKLPTPILSSEVEIIYRNNILQAKLKKLKD